MNFIGDYAYVCNALKNTLNFKAASLKMRKISFFI